MSYDLKKMKSLVKKIRDLEIILGNEKITISKKEKSQKIGPQRVFFKKKYQKIL